MSLRRYTRTKDGKTHTDYALVESVRTESGPRQHVVAYLGELNHDQERRWQRLQTDRAGLDRDPRRFPPGPPDAGGQHARSPDRRDHRRDDRGAVREITAGLGPSTLAITA